MNPEREGGGPPPVAVKDEPPPFLRTWNRLYAAIVVYTCALILALYLMTVTLNR